MVTLATVRAWTSDAPAVLNTSAHDSSVAPVVLTSSMSNTFVSEMRGLESRPRRRRNAPATFARRRSAANSTCARVCRARINASTTGKPRYRHSSRAWLKPREYSRLQWSGTGTTQSASARSSAPRSRIRTASGRASDRRPPYFNAWMMSLSAPSYSPTARARVTVERCLPHNAQSDRDWGLVIRDWCRPGVRGLVTSDWARRASGSPHVSHTGGVIGRTAVQQRRHTHPDNGSSSTASHTAQAGASNAATEAFRT